MADGHSRFGFRVFDRNAELFFYGHDQLDKIQPHSLSSAHEPNDFHGGAIGDQGIRPILLPNDFAIQLHRYLAGVDLQNLKQLCNIQALRNIFRLSVYDNVNRLCFNSFHRRV